MCVQIENVCVCVFVILLWLKYEFLISDSINICVCAGQISLWKQLAAFEQKSSAYQQNRACLEILEKTDRREQMLGIKKESVCEREGKEKRKCFPPT